VETTTQRIVELVLRLLDRLGAHLTQIAGKHDLTAIQAKVIWTLDLPCPMRAIADRLHCDASNVTGIVDRLESRGLVERRQDPADRRVKHVARTDAGDRLALELRADVFADVPAVGRLDERQQAQFIDLLELMVGDAVEPADSSWRAALAGPVSPR
jgi:DNA-binding MarR family transcriptional regulator